MSRWLEIFTVCRLVGAVLGFSVAAYWLRGAALYQRATAAYRAGDIPAGDRLVTRARRWSIGAREKMHRPPPSHPVFRNPNHNSELSPHIRQLSAREPTATCAVVTACQWSRICTRTRTGLLASKRAQRALP